MNEHDIRDFVEWDDEISTGEHAVLVWSVKTGYYFTQYGFVLGDELKIVARKK
jgi:hypothetical protein